MLVMVCLSWKCSEVKGVSYSVSWKCSEVKGVSYGVFDMEVLRGERC